MRVGIEFARGHLVAGPSAIDAETTYGSDLPADEHGRLTNLLLSRGIDPSPYLEEHFGDAPTEADILTHAEIISQLRRHFPSALFAGEEATRDENLAASRAPAGTRIFVLDAIDGSEQHAALGFGFSTNLLVMQRAQQDEPDQIEFAATLNSSLLCVGYERHPKRAFAGDAVDTDDLADWLHNEPKEDVVAVVGAKNSRPYREVMLELLGDNELRVYSAGGAPAAPAMAIGQLGALVHPKAHPAWDCPELPALALLGATIIPLNQPEPQILGFDDVVGLLARRDYLNKQAVPPMVVARTPRLALELHRRLHDHCRVDGA